MTFSNITIAFNNVYRTVLEYPEWSSISNMYVILKILKHFAKSIQRLEDCSKVTNKMYNNVSVAFINYIYRVIKSIWVNNYLIIVNIFLNLGYNFIMSTISLYA